MWCVELAGLATAWGVVGLWVAQTDCRHSTQGRWTRCIAGFELTRFPF